MLVPVVRLRPAPELQPQVSQWAARQRRAEEKQDLEHSEVHVLSVDPAYRLAFLLRLRAFRPCRLASGPCCPFVLSRHPCLVAVLCHLFLPSHHPQLVRSLLVPPQQQ